jgi:hypothetical protein
MVPTHHFPYSVRGAQEIDPQLLQQTKSLCVCVYVGRVRERERTGERGVGSERERERVYRRG